MARAKCGVLETDCSCTAPFSFSNSEPTMFEFSQVMRASVLTPSPVVYPDYYSTPYDQTADYGPATCPKDEEEIIVNPEKFRHVFYGYDDEHVFVGMANPNEDPDEEDLLTFDCGATTTVTESLYNMTDVVPKVVTIQLAMDGMTMKSSHIGIKTYYVYDRTGSIRPVKTKALYVRELKQDLLGGKALTNTNYRIVLDSDEEIAGVYPKADDGSIDPANSFPFVSEHSESLFHLRIAKISEQKYAKLSGYELWHRRLGHCPNESIRKSIAHSIGMDELKKARFDSHEKCPACAMGKAQRNNLPPRKERARKPMNRIYMDLVTSSVVSMEGYKYALVITDCCTGYRWLYGLRTKDEVLMAVKKWHSDIAELRDMHKIFVVMRDNSGENSSKEICEFLESKGIQNYFSTPYEQWQNGQPESSINSLMKLGRSVMVESGLGGQFWFSAMMAAKDARNATFKERIATTPWMMMHGRKRDVSKFRAFGCRAYIYLDEDRRRKGKHVPRAVEAINLGFATDHNMSAYKFYVPSTRKIMLCNQAKLMSFSSHTELGRFSNGIRTTTVPISWAEFLPDRSGSLTTSRSHRTCTKRSTTIVRVMS